MPCYTGTSSSRQSFDLWELWRCLFINTASPKTEWPAWVSYHTWLLCKLEQELLHCIPCIDIIKLELLCYSCWWWVSKQARPFALPNKGALSEYLQAKPCYQQGCFTASLSLWFCHSNQMNVWMLLSRCYVLQVAFALLGCIPGSIGLRGTFAPQGDEQDTVKVGPQSTQAP